MASSIPSPLELLVNKIREVEEEIKAAEKKLSEFDVESKQWDYWRNEKKQLRDELSELRKKENLLLQQQLLQPPGHTPSPESMRMHLSVCLYLYFCPTARNRACCVCVVCSNGYHSFELVCM